jgi:hypothetical protein
MKLCCMTRRTLVGGAADQYCRQITPLLIPCRVSGELGTRFFALECRALGMASVRYITACVVGEYRVQLS